MSGESMKQHIIMFLIGIVTAIIVLAVLLFSMVIREMITGVL